MSLSLEAYHVTQGKWKVEAIAGRNPSAKSRGARDILTESQRSRDLWLMTQKIPLITGGQARPALKVNPAAESAVRGRLRRVTSRQNSLVKELRQAFQRGELTTDGYCAVEGQHLAEEAIRSGLRFKVVFFSDEAGSRIEKLLPQISSHAEALILPDDVFRSAVDTETPQGVAALVKWPDPNREQSLSRKDPLLIGVVGLQDPGNLGTIVRSAEAFGAAAVLVGEKTVSEFNSKVIRASAGSVFRVPLIHLDLERIEELRGVRLLATSSHKGTPIDEVDLRGGVALMIGSEGAGLPRDYMARVEETIRIPQSERIESLNAGIAASIILYEAARQRRARNKRDAEQEP
jgi:RNA methyltransferase, TrmH family